MLSLSRSLERADVAMGEITNVKVLANQIAIDLIRPTLNGSVTLENALSIQERSLIKLASDDESGRQWLPAKAHIHKQFEIVVDTWKTHVKPAADDALKTGDANKYVDALSVFLPEANRLAKYIDLDDKKKRSLLRFLQGCIAVIGSVGTALAIYLLYAWFIQPMLRLRDGLQQLSTGNFHTRLPVNTRDEFGLLANGFNLMADTLERLYTELDYGVRSKTAELEKKNREIACLYSITAFLNLQNDSEAICRGFLNRVIDEFGACGGLVRVIASQDECAHALITVGAVNSDKKLSLWIDSEASFVDTNSTDRMMFRMNTRDSYVGTYAIFFSSKRLFSDNEIKLLNTLGQHLGNALDNRRLEARARKLAVTHERSLLAQGLHDSIAQGLNFLKFQLQLLEEALIRKEQADVDAFVKLLRIGVDESYQDVRELLVNFRTKLDHVEWSDAVEDIVGRFGRQTSISVSINTQYKAGPPLAPEQQIQVLFILQEALSNVRKHAKASHVNIVIRNEYNFEMEVIDNGKGYITQDVSTSDEEHVGLQIMRERATRLHAVLQIESMLDRGTTVRLILPHSERSIV